MTATSFERELEAEAVQLRSELHAAELTYHQCFDSLQHTVNEKLQRQRMVIRNLRNRISELETELQLQRDGSTHADTRHREEVAVLTQQLISIQRQGAEDRLRVDADARTVQAREGELREYELRLRQRDEYLLTREAEMQTLQETLERREQQLAAREEAFEAGLAPAQLEIERERARVQNLRQQTDQYIAEVREAADEVTTSKRQLDHERQRHEERMHLQLLELQERSQILFSSFAEWESTVEMRIAHATYYEQQIGRAEQMQRASWDLASRDAAIELQRRHEALRQQAIRLEEAEQNLQRERRVLQEQKLLYLAEVHASSATDGTITTAVETSNSALERLRKVKSLLTTTASSSFGAVAPSATTTTQGNSATHPHPHAAILSHSFHASDKTKTTITTTTTDVTAQPFRSSLLDQSPNYTAYHPPSHNNNNTVNTSAVTPSGAPSTVSSTSTTLQQQQQQQQQHSTAAVVGMRQSSRRTITSPIQIRKRLSSEQHQQQQYSAASSQTLTSRPQHLSGREEQEEGHHHHGVPSIEGGASFEVSALSPNLSAASRTGFRAPRQLSYV